ncbi:hypothetical protein HMPREF1051_1411 [Neisseria sicca VK64]|uniref:Uncharacterized protein n=1 Tax=Neisseria sicca VK64 TaxID=1095748 RepID=I2NNG7_NEISI|nr:hypothetical protein HMPREF1051_1411 [Neisseria sicca VK64]
MVWVVCLLLDRDGVGLGMGEGMRSSENWAIGFQTTFCVYTSCSPQCSF